MRRLVRAPDALRDAVMTVAAGYSWESTAKRYEAFYSGALSREAAPR